MWSHIGSYIEGRYRPGSGGVIRGSYIYKKMSHGKERLLCRIRYGERPQG
jgi:hypothetical protein